MSDEIIIKYIESIFPKWHISISDIDYPNSKGISFGFIPKRSGREIFYLFYNADKSEFTTGTICYNTISNKMTEWGTHVCSLGDPNCTEILIEAAKILDTKQPREKQMNPTPNIENRQYFECSCHSPEHIIMFGYWAEPDPMPSVEVTVHLDNQGFFKRCWIALKYVLGYKCQYGHFDEAMLRYEDVDRLIDLFTLYKADMQKQKDAWEVQWQIKQKSESASK